MNLNFTLISSHSQIAWHEKVKKYKKVAECNYEKY